jgi:glycosyltransferase involved in cell wall biosynthesis
MKRFIAVQTGARRNYAIPAILEKAGLLEALYTDLCADSGIAAVLDRILPQSLRKGSLNNLLNRHVSAELKSKIHTFDLATLRYLVRQKLAGKSQIRQHQALTRFDREFGQAMIDRGVGKATHIYSMFGEGSDFLEFSQKHQIKVVTEFYISFMTHKIVQSEREKYPFLEAPLPREIIEKDYNFAQKVCRSTDIFIVPSDFVIEGLKEFDVSLEKCRLVPYAVNDAWFDLQNNPKLGRVLFVGSAELRKGIHVLGMAAQKLSQRNYEFKIAGGVSDLIRDAEITHKLHFLGRVPRSEIQHEYALADIFVLPSFAEGSAEVVYEALAAGLPVITTNAAGSVVRDGVEGYIVPEGNVEALASRIEEIVENRELRNRMAIAARERAKDYTWEKYTKRLLSVFQTI